MFSITPRTSLVLLLALAVLIFAGGLRLARREESVRIDRDREALRRLSGELQIELQRLDALYESHLSRLARTVRPGDAFEVRRAADRLIGIRQFSLLHRDAKRSGADIHIQIDQTPKGHTPIPVLESSREIEAASRILLPKEDLFAMDGPVNGWIEQPGKAMMFWERVASDEVVVHGCHGRRARARAPPRARAGGSAPARAPDR